MSKDTGLLPHLVNRPLALLPAFALSPYRDERDTRPGLASAVAIIPIMGCLTSDEYGWWGTQTYGAIRRTFLAAMAADDVAAVALLVDCPGGTCNQLFDLGDTIYAARGTKPIRAILSDFAYSAAYLLASAADMVTVPRSGGTGSIGTLKIHTDVSEMLTKAGINTTLIQYGDRKTDGNPFQPLSDEARAGEQAEVDLFGEMFVDAVARNRGLKAADVKATQAATYIGAAGVEIGLADTVAAPDAAFADLVASL